MCAGCMAKPASVTLRRICEGATRNEQNGTTAPQVKEIPYALCVRVRERGSLCSEAVYNSIINTLPICFYCNIVGVRR